MDHGGMKKKKDKKRMGMKGGKMPRYGMVNGGPVDATSAVTSSTTVQKPN